MDKIEALGQTCHALYSAQLGDRKDFEIEFVRLVLREVARDVMKRPVPCIDNQCYFWFAHIGIYENGERVGISEQCDGPHLGRDAPMA